eukprot:TCONS_00073121-protein
MEKSSGYTILSQNVTVNETNGIKNVMILIDIMLPKQNIVTNVFPLLMVTCQLAMLIRSNKFKKITDLLLVVSFLTNTASFSCFCMTYYQQVNDASSYILATARYFQLTGLSSFTFISISICLSTCQIHLRDRTLWLIFTVASMIHLPISGFPIWLTQNESSSIMKGCNMQDALIVAYIVTNFLLIVLSYKRLISSVRKHKMTLPLSIHDDKVRLTQLKATEHMLLLIVPYVICFLPKFIFN